MHVAKIWRYPVKSLKGEPLDRAELTPDGVAGDRLVHVRRPAGVLTGRSRHGLLTVPAGTGPDGVATVGGHRWTSPQAAALVRAAGGPDAELAAWSGHERFDVANLLVATDGAVERFGHDVRRLRPNLLLAGVDADDEPDLPGRALAVGGAVVGVLERRTRCVVTTVDPDSGARDLEVLRHVRRAFDMRLALDCWVVRPGTVRVGDEVRLVDLDGAEPAHVGGWILGTPYDVPSR